MNAPAILGPVVDAAMPRVSVVVPTVGRIDLLRRCLRALTSQTLPATDYEVLVADDSGGEAVGECVAAMARPGGPSIRCVTVGSRRGPAAARNRGWLEARAAVVAFTDDDTVPRAEWLEQGLQALSLPGPDGERPGAVAGRIVMPLPEPPTDYERDAAQLAQAEFATANCLVLRRALFDLGGFDERFAVAWREDSDLQFRLMEAGWSIVRAPAAVVVHPIRAAHWGVSLAQQRKIRFDALLYKKHPRLYRRRIRSGPPWTYLAIVAALVLAVGGALAGHATAAVVGTIAWIALTAELCRRRLRGTLAEPADVLEMLVTSIAIPPVALYWRLVGAWQFRVAFL